MPWLVDEMAVAAETIYDIALQVPGVINCHYIASRGVIGRQVFIEMHLIIDAFICRNRPAYKSNQISF